MSSSDPMAFAVQTANMGDAELASALHAIATDTELSDFQRAVLDEAQCRGMLQTIDTKGMHEVKGS